MKARFELEGPLRPKATYEHCGEIHFWAACSLRPIAQALTMSGMERMLSHSADHAPRVTSDRDLAASRSTDGTGEFTIEDSASCHP